MRYDDCYLFDFGGLVGLLWCVVCLLLVVFGCVSGFDVFGVVSGFCWFLGVFEFVAFMGLLYLLVWCLPFDGCFDCGCLRITYLLLVLLTSFPSCG